MLDPASETYALDVVSVIEATLEDPRQILSAQLKKARGEAVAAMKAEGIEYDERIALLDDDQLSQAARRRARPRLRRVPAEQPVGRRRSAVAEVDRARDVGAGVHLPGVRQRLRADPLRGRRAALPLRRVQGAAVRRPRRGPYRRGHRRRRVARRACPPSGFEPARRVGAADQPRPAAGRTRWRCRPARAR